MPWNLISLWWRKHRPFTISDINENLEIIIDFFKKDSNKISFTFHISFKSEKEHWLFYSNSWKRYKYIISNKGKKPTHKANTKKWRKGIKSDNYCYRKVGRTIDIFSLSGIISFRLIFFSNARYGLWLNFAYLITLLSEGLKLLISLF